MKRARGAHHGLLLVDKVGAMTSHRVVAAVRRAIGSREVGHAGTLDPMATGLLVLGVGEGTKLLAHLTGQDKHYEAVLRLGSATDTLDADGSIVQTAPVPPAATLERAPQLAQGFVGEKLQVPPVISAIKQQGVALHLRARRGEQVDPAPRAVTLHRLDVEVLASDTLRLVVHCGKGYYVRALGRDLAMELGTCGHLIALRRTASGPFDVQDAVPFDLVHRAALGDLAARDELEAKLVCLPRAVTSLPRVVVDDVGCEDARQGRVVHEANRMDGEWPPVGTEPVAVLSQAPELVALARATERGLEVMRGFRYA